jgi:hypothetical protein
MKFYLIAFLFVVPFISRNSNQQKDACREVQAKIVSIKKVSTAYILKAVIIPKADTIDIVSFSVNFYDKNRKVGNKINEKKATAILRDSIYHFVLYKPSQYRADPVSLKLMIVLDQDTIWQGNNSNTAPFYGKNCRGLLISKN